MYCIFIQYENRYESMTVVAIVDYVCGPLLSLPHCTHYPHYDPPTQVASYPCIITIFCCLFQSVSKMAGCVTKYRTHYPHYDPPLKWAATHASS